MSNLGKFAVVALAVCGLAAWAVFLRTTQEDRDFDSAERRRTVQAMRSFQRRYPGGKRADDAKRAIGRLILDGRDRIVATAVDPDRPALEVVTALFGALAKRGDPIVAVKLADPTVFGLGDAGDVSPAAAIPGVAAAPLSSLQTRSLQSYRYDLATAIERVLAEAAGDSVVLVDKFGDTSDARPGFEVAVAIRPSARVFHVPGAPRAFRGIELDGTIAVTLPGRDPVAFDATVGLPADYSLDVDATGAHVETADGAVYAGMATTAFEQLIQAWLAHATGAPAPAK